MTNRKADNINPIWIILAILAIAALVLCFTPGMLLVSIVNDTTTLNLDQGQMWTFGIITSLAFFGGFYYKNNKELKPAMTKYAILSLMIVAVLALLSFGFKLKFPEKYWDYFFEG